MTNPTRHRTARTHALPKGARLVALLGVLLLLVSSCAGVEEPTPDHAAVSARYAHQSHEGQSPETPKTAPAATARPVQSQAAPVQSPKVAAPDLARTTPPQAETRTPWYLEPRPAEPPKDADQSSAPAAPPAPLENTVVDFASCIRLAVERSPYLQSPSLEIQVKKLDEKDAWYRMFPNLNFTLLSDRKIAGEDTSTSKTGDSSLTLGLTSGSYNPIAAWIQHDAQKDVTRLAKMGAVLALQEVIQQIATAFITLDYLERQLALRRDIIDLNERALVFATKLENIHTSQIDIKIALQKKNLAQTEYDMALALKGQVLMSLRDLLGLGPYDLIQPDTHQFRELVRQFDP
ncbi:TolC family protein, partial [Desulfovibrio sp.]